MIAKNSLTVLCLLFAVTLQQGASAEGGAGGSNPFGGQNGAAAGIVVGCLIALFCCCHICERDQEITAYLMRYKNIYYSRALGGSQPHFEQIQQSFLKMLRLVSSRRKKLVFVQNGIEIESIIYDVRSKKSQFPSILEISMKGNDELDRNLGAWRGEGAFMMTEQQPFFWMLKFYDNRQREGDINDWQLVIYESVGLGENWCEGRWFLQNMEFSPHYSGTWRIH